MRHHHTSVVGLQWGDEAKGKIVDMYAAAHDVVVRYNGGPNAGHSVQANGQEISLHGLPSGVLHPHTRMYITPGCVVSLPGLLQEINDVKKVTGEDVRGRLGISPETSIIQPHHMLNDLVTMQEIGTTGKGISPTYADQKNRMQGHRRVDIRVANLLDCADECFAWMRQNLLEEFERARNFKDIDPEKLKKIIRRFENVDAHIDEQRRAFEQLRSCIDIDPDRLIKWFREGLHFLFEGAQAAGLDNIRGTAPYTTGSLIGTNFALGSAGLPAGTPVHTVGVGKLITSRVGNGPFVSELGGRASEVYCMAEDGQKHTKDVEQATFGHRIQEMLASGDPLQIGQAIRLQTGEYGVTSKRPRRVGAFDAVQFQRMATNVHHVQEVVLSKLDCLNLFAHTREKRIPIVTGYVLHGRQINHVPTTEQSLNQVSPSFDYFNAFEEDISGVRDADHLPSTARTFLQALEEKIERPISIVGVGPKREQVVYLNSNH